MKRAKKIQKLQKIQGIAPEKTAAGNKGKAETAPAGDLADGISENFDKFELWFIENGKKIVAVCIVILIAVAAYYSVQYVINKNKAEVSSKFANADTAEKLMTVLKENSNAPEAFAASLAVAADHVAKKEYDKAVALYTKISQSAGDEFVARKAALSVAYITEVKGKEKEAALLFARIADDIKAPEGIRAEAAYGAGRLYFKAKDTVSARKYLSLFNSSSMTGRDAGQWAALSRAILNRMAKPAPVKMVPVKKSAVPAVKKAPAAAKKAPAVKKAPAAAKKAAK